MRVPLIQGVIDRRILVNYQVDPEALRAVLPANLEPKIVGGVGIGGICLIRLRAIRPRFVPPVFGLGSENAAHRIAVILPDGTEGVFIPRRDTSSYMNVLAGGRLFPGVHHHSTFDVRERDEHFDVRLTREDGTVLLAVTASVTSDIAPTSVFSTVDEASEFFEAGSLGYSPSATEGTLDGIELQTLNWHVVPLNVESVFSSFFEDEDCFPRRGVRFDSALLMRDIRHQWRARQPLYCGQDRSDVQAQDDRVS